MEQGTSRSNRSEGPQSDRSILSRLFETSESDDDLVHTALRYAHQIRLSLPVTFLAVDIADSVDNPTTRGYYSPVSLAATSIYIATQILNQPISLTDIASTWAISERTIHSVYREMYSERYEMINETWRQLVGGANLFECAEALPSLLWPPLEYGFTDGEGEDDDRRYSGLDCPRAVYECCVEYRWDNAYDDDIWAMAQNIAAKMDTMTLDWKTVNPWTFAAACTYMASHLVMQAKTIQQISTLEGVTPTLIQNTYEVMYNVREEIVQEEWFVEFDWTRDNALHCLPQP